MLVIATVKPCHSSFPLFPTKLMIPGEVTAVNVAILHLPLLISCTSGLLLCRTPTLLLLWKNHKCLPTCPYRRIQWHYLRNVCWGRGIHHCMDGLNSTVVEFPQGPLEVWATVVHPEGLHKPTLSVVGEAQWYWPCIRPSLGIQQRGAMRNEQEHRPLYWAKHSPLTLFQVWNRLSREVVDAPVHSRSGWTRLWAGWISCFPADCNGQ